eukprot:GEMP01033060.1.p1 GENE.GEMP01033060.1~~GEMP01033060.1.p1  ORF type:complete len:511 (+),score=127.86 GEMP01033060.1:94-1626(+)
MAGRHLRILREEQVRFARERVFGIRENMPGDRYFQKPLEGRELMRHHFPSKFGFQDFKVQEFVEMQEERFRPRKTHEFRARFKDTIAQIQGSTEVQHRLHTYFSRVAEDEFYNSEPLQDLYSLYRMVVPRTLEDTLQFSPNPKVHLDHAVLPAHYPFSTPHDAFTYDKWLIFARLEDAVDLKRKLNAAEVFDAKRSVLDDTMAELGIQRPMFLDPVSTATLDFCLIIERAPDCPTGLDDGFFCKEKFMETLKEKRNLSEIRQLLDEEMTKYKVRRPLIGEHHGPRSTTPVNNDSEDIKSSSSAEGTPTNGEAKAWDVVEDLSAAGGFDIDLLPSEAEADALEKGDMISGEAKAGGVVEDLSRPIPSSAESANGATASEAAAGEFNWAAVSLPVPGPAGKAFTRSTTLRDGRVRPEDVHFFVELLASVGEPAVRGHPENNPLESTSYQKRHRFIDPMFRRRRLKWLERLQSRKNNDREIKYNQYYMAHPDNQERWPLNKGSVTVQYPSRHH